MFFPSCSSRSRSRSDRPGTHSLFVLLAVLPLLAAAVACGGSSGSPTEPPAPELGGTASISGQVSVSGGALTTPGSPAVSGPGSPTAMTAADSTGVGVVVRVVGTSLATTAGPEGSFRLNGAPHGDIQLQFETGSRNARVGIDQVQPKENIRIQVQIDGSQARVQNMERDGGDPENEDGPGEEEVEVDLTLDVQPDDWNTNYEHSAGTVTAFIRGDGFELVLLDTLELSGTAEEAEPLLPVDASRQGNHVRARFAKSDLLDLLEDPEPGSVHTVTLSFFVDGVEEIVELSEDVVIVGPADDGEGDEEDEEEEEELGDLSLQLSPSTWNTNYPGSAGNVTAFIRGTGLDAIDTDSIELVGDDPEAVPLPASFARLEGNHVRAQFPKSELLDLLDEPNRGTRHTVLVTFTANDGAESFELEAEVRVTGKEI